MTTAEHMNYLALNQNILNKLMVIGSSPSGGGSKTPKTTLKGLKVYLNGEHVMPLHSELDELYTIGSMTHPDAMNGMPGCGGELSYEFWVTKEEYIIIVRLKLDESINGESEPAADILTIVKKAELPENIEDIEKNYPIISQEMMLCHFDSLFEFYENIESTEDWCFNDDTLYSYVKHHFDLKKQ
jgi:hypothetical protein